MQVNSTGPGVARVTISGMKAALALVFVALVAAGCGRAENGDSQKLREEADRARAAAAEALDAVDSMRVELDALEDRIARRGEERARVAGKLRKTREHLWRAVSGLRETISGLRDESSGAASEAASALAEAQSAAKTVAVLESRFEYHLRRDHGGG
jgi:hypothetical protein